MSTETHAMRNTRNRTRFLRERQEEVAALGIRPIRMMRRSVKMAKKKDEKKKKKTKKRSNQEKKKNLEETSQSNIEFANN